MKKIFLIIAISLISFNSYAEDLKNKAKSKFTSNFSKYLHESLGQIFPTAEVGLTSGKTQKVKGDIIKTSGQDTVLRVPKRNIDDRKFIKSIGSAVMKLQFDAEKMSIKDRDDHIITSLSQMEEKGVF